MTGEPGGRLPRRAADCQRPAGRGVRRARVIFNHRGRNFGMLNATAVANTLTHRGPR